ncbi:NADH dehydrogenase [ubiquinone] 1 beta subcomplex subunit 8, mitochondrial-like [Physeter macrocephalus]|uniref:NADH dehydrogenase [ubiquinone] 1 beta subcomplex subunit 8, mitochondrial-like n=1 Tax=Physeter macrocephalus TaxID=9755 RepID=A0A9W2WA06_PHYMC|nr:NADH dehydrogenase [ubiquinone] 1 beta subcomplex subunit 8, mitochondrial-like [Physeter catodon]
MCGVKQEGEDGSSQGGGPGSPMAAKGSPKHGADGCTDRYGDYLKLPDHSQQERDPWYDWDHPDLQLNWGEPTYWDLDMYIRNRVDMSPTPVSWNLMCKHLFGFVAFMLFIFWVRETYPTYQPVGPKQYTYNNLYLERGGNPNKEPEAVFNYEI